KPLVKSRTELKDFLKAGDSYPELKKLMWDVLRSDANLSENTWNVRMDTLVILLRTIMPDANCSRVREFLAWSGNTESDPNTRALVEADAQNVLLHRSRNGEISLRFDSIHG